MVLALNSLRLRILEVEEPVLSLEKSHLITDLFTRRGIKILGQTIVHSWRELFFLEQILDKYQFKVIIETGTYEGGLTLFFALHALRMGAEVLTFDIEPEPNEGLYKLLKPQLPLTFFRLSSTSGEAVKIIEEAISRGRTLLYCDAQKVEEFNLYAPLLKTDDVVMAHDRGNELAKEQKYSREIYDKDIADTVNKCSLEPFYDEEANQFGSIYTFVKKG
jgi:cephalosporin hydroxylase